MHQQEDTTQSEKSHVSSSQEVVMSESKEVSMSQSQANQSVGVEEKKSAVEKLDEKKVQMYVEQIDGAIRKTQDSILRLAAIVYDAKTHLNAKEWARLEQHVGSAAQLSKYGKIGERLAVLTRYKDQLPKAASVLYHIASKLTEQQIEQSIQSGSLNYRTTHADATNVINATLGITSHPKMIKVVKVDQSANVVTLVVNTTNASAKEVQTHRSQYEAALNLIKRGLDDLKAMGFAIPEETIKGITESLTIDVPVRDAA